MAHAKPKVAFIDDSATVRMVLEGILEQGGCEPFACTSWEELERAVAEHEPDLVLLDVEMPKISGAPMALVLKKIRPDLRVVYHSDQDARRLAELTAKTGADGYIRKSTDADQTLEAIRRYLPPRP